MNVCYVGGCGRLGLSLAVWTAHKGHNVICADINEEAVDMVNRRECPISEAGVAEMLRELPLIVATTDITSAVLASDIIVVIVPTPSCEDGSFSIKHVLAACKNIGKAIGPRHLIAYEKPLVIISSTVMPGDTEGLICQTLEDASGQLAGSDFGLVYSPEFIRQGRTMHDFANPDLVLIGGYDQRSSGMATLFFHSVVENHPPFYFMSPTSAEIAKIGLNSAVVAKMSMANQIAWLCHKTPGADARDVLGAIGADSRIGSKYFNAGPWEGGPCFPRDNRALERASASAGVSGEISAATMVFRDQQFAQLQDLIYNLGNLPEQPAIFGPTVCVLGLAYKEGVDITEESPGQELYDWLVFHSKDYYAYNVVAYDPAVREHKHDLTEVVENSDVLVVMTRWPEFRELEDMDLEGKIVIDMWGYLDNSKLNCTYVRFGRGS